MSSIDNRVVEMQFDNKQFESGVSQTMSTLDKLKRALNLSESSKNVKALSDNLETFGGTSGALSKLSSAVSSISSRFSTLGIVGMTAISNITTAAMNAGSQIVRALSIEPILSGFQEYETQMNAVQTILANTSNKGTTLDEVNDALDTLNTYADKTIYNFTEMTRNIGTFTAAGVDLKTSVDAIQGIANLAAVSGSTSTQASVAMYQLSQALASGTVKLMDWNSVINAGMGGEVFQQALIRTSEHLQTGAKAAIEAEGSFRESLQTGWLTTEVLTETLRQFALAVDTEEDYNKAIQDLVSSGYTQEEAKAIADMAKTAGDAATKVKTFTQLVDTLKEALGSGRTQSWEIIIGDFEEAKALWTEVSDVLSNAINESAASRNELLQTWADLGGRQDLIDGLSKAFSNLVQICSVISEAFLNIFPPKTAQDLYELTNNFKSFIDSLEPSEQTLTRLKNIFEGLFSAFDIGIRAVKSLFDAFSSGISNSSLPELADNFFDAASNFGLFLTELNKSESLSTGISKISDAIRNLTSGIIDGFSNALTSIFDFNDVFSNIGETFGNVFQSISEGISTVVQWIKDNVTLDDVFSALIGGASFAGALELKDFFSKINEFFDSIGSLPEKGKSFSESFSEVLDSLRESIDAFTMGIKATTLLEVAAAIGILAHALTEISKLDLGQISQSLFAIGVMMGELMSGFKSITKTLNKSDSSGMIQAGVALVLIAEAIKILSDSLIKISSLSFDELVGGLAGIGGLLAELSLFLQKTELNDISLQTSVALLAIAESVSMLSDSMISISSLSWEEIGKGLVGIGGALLELCGALKIINDLDISLTTSVAVLALAESCKLLAEAFSTFSSFSWDEIARGLVAMGGALGEFVGALAILNKVGGENSLLGSISILIASQALDPIASALSRLSQLTWDEIGRGLAAMGGALGELGLVSGALGNLSGFNGVIGAAALDIAVQSLEPISSALERLSALTWDEIGRGLAAMGGALGELGLVSGALGNLSGLGGILGGESLTIAVQTLEPIANALSTLSQLTWDEIGRGLAAMGGALGELAAISGLSGTLAPLSFLGSASIVEAVSGLNDLASALQKFGEMSWDEIGRGLSAMAGALGETALGGLLNTFSGFGADAIAQVAEPLGTLADSVKKWSDVSVPEGLGGTLGDIAGGIGSFFMSGWGADALSTIAEPLGTLADSVKKWSGVSVPEGLGEQIGSLASGIEAFGFSGWGADSLTTFAEPLGTLADSVKKWSGVTIPENLTDDLKKLADGIGAFTLSFTGGWSISQITQPLSDFADAAQKWSGVAVPENVEDQLRGLSNGISSFALAFVGGWSLGAVTGPLGSLADSVSKWSGVSIPENIQTDLESLANGVNAFAGSGISVETLSGIATSLSSLKDSINTLSGTNFEGISSGFSSLGNAIMSFPTDLANAADQISNFANSVSSSAAAITSNLSSGILANRTPVTSSMQTVIDSIKTTLSSSYSDFINMGNRMTVNLGDGIRNGSGKATGAAKTVLIEVKSIVASYEGSLYTTGLNLMRGLARGISSGQASATRAASNAASAVIRATNNAAAVKSPSRKTMKTGMYLMEGLALGIEKNVKTVDNSAMKATKSVISNFKFRMSDIESLTQYPEETYYPVISPVFDDSKLGSFSNLLTDKTNVLDVNVRTPRVSKNQNGTFSDVVKAVNDLRGDLQTLPTNTYTVGGITYDDGSAMSAAVKQLIRTSRVERRK